jgi:ABC-2 type transport system ATP-binding protein
MQSSEYVVQVDSVSKNYGKVTALRDVSLSIPRGQAIAVIGQNGAGKTTLMEIIVNLRRADRGSVSLLGLDVPSHPNIVSRIGIQLQQATMFPMVKVRRYLDLFSKLYGVAKPSDELIDQLGLRNHLNKKFSELSGGLKQRTLLALALLNDPEILILDEPSTGLDPVARETLWLFIENWLKDGKRTLLLTSHFMDEVERLCSRVVVLVEGQIVADDSVPGLLRQMPPTVTTLQSAYCKLVGVAE